MVFAERDAVRVILFIRNLEQAAPGQFACIRRRCVSLIHNEPINVDKRDRCLLDLADSCAGASDEHRNAAGFLIMVRLSPLPARARILTMIGPLNDARATQAPDIR